MKDKKVKDIISQCNYLIIPIQASIFDQTATNLFLELINKLSRIRKGKTAARDGRVPHLHPRRDFFFSFL